MIEPGFSSMAQARPAAPATPRADILVLSKRFDAQGGVVNFVHSLVSNLPAHVRAEHLPIGRTPRRNPVLSGFLAPVVDNIRLARWAIRNRSACIHVNPSLDWNSLIRDGVFLLTLSLVGHRRTFVLFHGWEDAVAARIARNPLLRALFLKTFGRAGLICVLASKFQRALIAMGVDGRRIELATTMFDGRIFEGKTRSRHDSAPVMLFMSRLVREKGVFETLAAFASIANRFPGAQLVIAGDGPELDRLRREAARCGIASRVSFVGYLTGQVKAQMLLDADLYVFPSYTEGCPVALLEAMAAGLPVIANAVGGIPDIFEDGVNGVLIDGVCVPTLASHMTTLLSDRGLRERIGDENRRRAWRSFEARIGAEYIAGLYRRLAGEADHGHVP